MQKNYKNGRESYEFQTHITQQMYDELIHLQKGASFQTISDLCRHILKEKIVVAKFIEGPTDTLLLGITTACEQLQQKCSEIGRLTGRIFGETDPEVLLADAREVRRILIEVNNLLDPLQTQIEEISRRWLSDEKQG